MGGPRRGINEHQALFGSCLILDASTGPYLSHAGYMGVVPRIVVDKNSPVGHRRDLVSVIPPGHHFCILPNQRHGIINTQGR